MTNKDIFNNKAVKVAIKTAEFLFAHNERYIKADGSKFHSGKLKSFFEKAAFKGYVTATAAVVGGDLLANGQLDNDAISLAIGLTCGLSLLYQNEYYDGKQNSNFVFENKAIDTEGRSLSAKKLSLIELYYLKSMQKIWLKNSLLHSIMGVTAVSVIDPVMSIVIAPVVFRYLSLACRLNKIVKGHSGEPYGYVICDDPPAKLETKKSPMLSIAGLRSPS